VACERGKENGETGKIVTNREHQTSDSEDEEELAAYFEKRSLTERETNAITERFKDANLDETNITNLWAL
jgi:hypothetical protein